MTIVSEKMYVGATSKDVKSKKLQMVSEEIGAFADNTLEIQQGDGKAVVQLDGGNASVGGSKTQIYGATTINDKTEVKGELKAPKVSGDSIEAKSAFKSPNISDGMSAGAGGGGGSLSAKLKAEDAPKEN
jgi:citrate lyase alpha subunit